MAAQGAEWDKLAQLSVSDGDPPKPPSAQQESKTAVAVDEGVDTAIKGALQGPERSIVLKIEEQVDAFVRDQTPDVLEFPSNFSNYQRMLAHKVAQHYKLQTSTVGYEAGQGRVVAKRTAWAAPPAVKLADLDVKSFKGPMPGAKALIRRPNSGDLGGRSASQGSNEQAAPAPKSHKEREEEYNAARERIIGKQQQQQGQGQQQQQQGQGQQQQQQQGQQQQPAGTNMDSGYSSAGSSSSALTSAASIGRGGGGGGERGRGFAITASAGRGTANGRGRGVASPAAPGAAAVAAAAAAAASGRGGKAVYRDRDRDVQDPDYRRGVSRYQPRFDPGYGPQMQGMYAIPTYGSEFPPMQSPNAAGTPGAVSGAGYPAGGMPMHPGAMYGAYPMAMPSFRPPPPPPPSASPAGGSPHTGGTGDGAVPGYASGQPVAMGSMAMGMGARPYGAMLTPVPVQAMQMGYHGMPHGAMPAHAGGPAGGHPAMYGAPHPLHMAHMVPASYGYMQAQMGEGTMMAMTPQGPVPVYAAGGYHPGVHPYQQGYPTAHMLHMPRAASGSAGAGGGDERGGQHHGQQRGGYGGSGQQEGGGRGGGGGKKEGKASAQQQ